MKSLIFGVCFVVLMCLAMVESSKNSLRFETEREDRELFDFLMKPRFHKAQRRLGSYAYKNCGDPKKELFLISNLTLGPDPLSFPGDLQVNFAGVIKTNLDAPLKAEVVIERRVGPEWIKIPCLGKIGSCTYDDLCELLAGATCPPPFVDNHIPCKCPFPKGTYKLPETKIEVDAAVFPAGDYHATANLTYKGQSVACVDLHASIE